METNSHKSWTDAKTERDDLDRTLDAALAKYAAVEPRAGLEERILAHLQSTHHRIPTRSWWQWSAVGVVAMLLMVAAIAWKWSSPGKNVVQQHPSVPVRSVQPSPTQVAMNKQIQPIGSHDPQQRTPARRHSAPQSALVADGPKLDQFPSPRPLTPEELALARYTRQFPQDAMMIASAQEEFEKAVQQEAASGQQDTSNTTKEER